MAHERAEGAKWIFCLWDFELFRVIRGQIKFSAARPAVAPYLSVLFMRSVVKLFRLCLAKFLKSRIVPQRVKHGIEPKQRRGEGWHGFSEGAFIRYRQKFP